MNTPGTPARRLTTATGSRTMLRVDKLRPQKQIDSLAGDMAAEKPRGHGHTKEQDAFDSEISLFYHDPQTTRGAGSNPGFGGDRSFLRNDNPFTPFGRGGLSPVADYSFTNARVRPQSPVSLATSPWAAAPPPAPEDFSLAQQIPGNASGRAPAEQGLWVTLFGFPQGYQDGMLKILRDRGEILDHSYSGTNYISVKFTNTQAVADALGLNGTILPADGLPGENYMIGVKRGGTCTERGDTAVLSVFNNPLSPAPQNRGDKRDALQRGGGVGVQKVHEPGLKGSMSRFLSELFDITDLSIRD